MRQHGNPSRRLSIRDLLGFGIGLLAFLGLGRLFKRPGGRRGSRARAYETPQHRHAPGGPDHPGHETRDITVSPLVMIAVGVLVAGLIGHLVLWNVFSWYNNRLARMDPAPAPLARTAQPPPGPLLQVAPRADLQQMLADHNGQLNSYGWVDQQAGTVRIPIDRAMDLLLERGLPARSGGEFQEWPDEGRDLESEGGQPPGSEGGDR